MELLAEEVGNDSDRKKISAFVVGIVKRDSVIEASLGKIKALLPAVTEPAAIHIILKKDPSSSSCSSAQQPAPPPQEVVATVSTTAPAAESVPGQLSGEGTLIINNNAAAPPRPIGPSGHTTPAHVLSPVGPKPLADVAPERGGQNESVAPLAPMPTQPHPQGHPHHPPHQAPLKNSCIRADHCNIASCPYLHPGGKEDRSNPIRPHYPP